MLSSQFVGDGPFAQKPEKGSGFLGVATEVRAEGGLLVTKVGRETPAELGGIKEGDILLKLNGTELQDRDQFLELMKEMAAGDKLELQLLRDGAEQTLNLRLGER